MIYAKKEAFGFMQRLTQRMEDKTVQKAPHVQDAEILERLARYEDMHQQILQQLAKTTARIEELKRNGKEKTATHRQLLGKKLQYVSFLSHFDAHDL